MGKYEIILSPSLKSYQFRRQIRCHYVLKKQAIFFFFFSFEIFPSHSIASKSNSLYKLASNFFHFHISKWNKHKKFLFPMISEYGWLRQKMPLMFLLILTLKFPFNEEINRYEQQGPEFSATLGWFRGICVKIKD